MLAVTRVQLKHMNLNEHVELKDLDVVISIHKITLFNIVRCSLLQYQ